MTSPLADLALPAFHRMLNRVSLWLVKAASHAEAQGLPPAALLRHRLAPDMFDLSRQVEILASAARGGAARLAGRLDPLDSSPALAVFNRGSEEEFGPPAAGFGELQALLSDAVAELAQLARGQITVDAGTRITVAKPGNVRVFEAHHFVLDYLLPNLYFHASIAYALLRAQGVPLGKQDFEGPPSYRLA